ncbi:leucine-rich repeat-containing protein 38-like [Toxorhynchites rutilus septentrionalis]|uniref:leucine-rich repeat-containing protein 38-like n=1 Tax=Toxorhynchites rutilus septentrionalis TaxID=329112 RepID=UPI00247B04CE|nr:leucine-rich repeat-containing protein 38-like [Toxorhynchites rutilus septentrionalis]
MITKLVVYWTLIVVAVLLTSGAHADVENRDQQCGKCRCEIMRADCSNLQLSFIPYNLSSNLQALDLSYNRIVEIRAYEIVYRNQENLLELYIRNSSIQRLHRDAFRNMSMLIMLDLQENQLKRLEPGLFDDMVELRHLILNNNELTQIEYTLLLHVPMLSYMNLDVNGLRSLHLVTFIHLTKLNSLSLRYNPWDCSCDFVDFAEFARIRGLYNDSIICADPPLLTGKRLNDTIELDELSCNPLAIMNHIYSVIVISLMIITIAILCYINCKTRILREYTSIIAKGLNNSKYRVTSVAIELEENLQTKAETNVEGQTRFATQEESTASIRLSNITPQSIDDLPSDLRDLLRACFPQSLDPESNIPMHDQSFDKSFSLSSQLSLDDIDDILEASIGGTIFADFRTLQYPKKTEDRTLAGSAAHEYATMPRGRRTVRWSPSTTSLPRQISEPDLEVDT